MTSTEDIWFSGPVKDAVSLVAERNCVFLVYIYDDSEKSNILNATLKDEKVIETIKKYAVALSMKKDSENAKLFGQFYPTQTVPIIYLIKQGTIKDFGLEIISSQEIVKKISKLNEIPTSDVIGEQQQQQPALVTPIPEQITATTASSSSTTSTAATTTAAIEENEAKKAELQKQLNQVRKERAERELKDAKDREIKRRQEAKLMQEVKQSKVEKENKIYFDKIKKERLEDEAHRRKVRQQIATDRAEKIAQRNAEKQRKSSSSTSFDDGIIGHQNDKNKEHYHDSSHLNIRQLDGTNIRHRFEASAKLAEVREWIKENRTDDNRKSYKLSSQFPTRSFTEADDDVSLVNLDLCPSATIIMKPMKVAFSSSNSVSSIGSRGGVLGYAMKSFDFVYGILLALINILADLFASLFPTNGSVPHTISPSQRQQQSSLRNLRGGQRLGGESFAESSNRGESSANARNEALARKRNPYATRVNTLQENNMDDDEKRPTYNGNSVNHE